MMNNIIKIFKKHRRNHYSGMGQCFSLIEQQLCTEDLIIHDPKSSIIVVTKRGEKSQKMLRTIGRFNAKKG